MSILYRIRQFCRALHARVTPDEKELLVTRLTPAQLALFYRLPEFDQRHSLDVYHALVAQGHNDPALLTAALLHDVAKGQSRIRLWHRVATVLIQAIPKGKDQLAGIGYWPSFCDQLQHAQQSAALAEAVGCDPITVMLIREHHTPTSSESTFGRLLLALQRADGQH